MPLTLAEQRRNPNWELETDESPWRSRHVHLGKDGFWSDSDDGTGTYCTLLPVYDPRDYVAYDVIAWVPECPCRWWWQRGIATVLGEQDIRDAEWEKEPMIRLVETPATWLLSTLPCACILDWRADLRRILGSVQRIECSSMRLARGLDARLAEQVRHRYSIRVRPRR